MYAVGAQNRFSLNALTGLNPGMTNRVTAYGCFAAAAFGHYRVMAGAFAIAIALVLIGIILAVVVPGVGPILGIILVIVGIVLLFGGVAGRRRRAGTAPGP